MYFKIAWFCSTLFWEQDFPGGSSGEEPTCQCKRCGFDPCVGKILWRREWLHMLVFCPGEFHQEKQATIHRVAQSRTWLKWLSTHGPRIPQCLFFSSVQFSSVQSLSSVRLFAPHGLQHARLPCPSLSSGVCSNSCPSSQWCHPIISSSVVPFSSCLQSFLTSGSFPMSQFFASGGQRIGASALASVLPMNI